MLREVTALKSIIEVEGIPRVLDDNVESWRDADIPLYFVMEFIEGPTLQELIERNSIDVETCITFGARLFEILEQLHEVGIVHRDLKPNNVILKQGSAKNPHIVDFGQNFTFLENGESVETPPNEQIGNRFLALPELQRDGSYKRDPRSDVTCAAGLVFFGLTGVTPRVLQDEKGRLPHQTVNLSEEAFCLKSFFDRSFQLPVDQRWQSAKTAHQALSALLDKSEPAINTEAIIEKINSSVVADSTLQKQKSVKQVLERIVGCIGRTVQRIVKEVGDGNFQYTQGGRRFDLERYLVEDQIGVSLHGDSSRRCFPQWKAELTGSEVVVSFLARGVRTEVYRVPMSAADDLDDLSNSVRDTMIQLIEVWLNDGSRGLGSQK